MITAAELRSIREEIPSNFAQLVIYSSEQLINCSTTTFCNTVSQQNVALNCCRLLIRIIPYVYEDEDFSKLLWSDINLEEDDVNNKEKLTKKPESPRNFKERKLNKFKDDDDSDDIDTENEEDEKNEDDGNNEFANDQYDSNYKKPLAIKLINAICDLLFCPEFTVIPAKLNNKGSKSKSSGN